MAGAWTDMAADQDVPLQADHHQPGQEEADDDDEQQWRRDHNIKMPLLTILNQPQLGAGARPGEPAAGRGGVVRADEAQPGAASAQMGQLSTREGEPSY